MLVLAYAGSTGSEPFVCKGMPALAGAGGYTAMDIPHNRRGRSKDSNLQNWHSISRTVFDVDLRREKIRTRGCLRTSEAEGR